MPTTFDPHTNFGFGRIATAPSPADTGTSFVLESGQGANFPIPADGDFNVTVVKSEADFATAQYSEIVRVTNRVTDTFTITREQEGTDAIDIEVGDLVILGLTNLTVEQIKDAINALESDVDTLQSDTTTLDSRLDTAESNITTLDTRLDTAEPEIDTLQTEMDNVETGWVAAGETWTYASNTAVENCEVATLTISGDKTTKYYAGMKVKFTQSTGGVKYGIITKAAYSAPNTTLTIFLGVDYTLNNEAITSPYFSVSRCPAGFNMDATKWTVRVADTSQRTQSNPVDGTYYNLNTTDIVIPIGLWEVSYDVCHDGRSSNSSSNGVSVTSALSTSNNSVSDAELKTHSTIEIGSNGGRVNIDTVHRNKLILLAAETTYYLISTVGGALATTGSLNWRGDLAPTLLEARCAYL